MDPSCACSNLGCVRLTFAVYFGYGSQSLSLNCIFVFVFFCLAILPASGRDLNDNMFTGNRKIGDGMQNTGIAHIDKRRKNRHHKGNTLKKTDFISRWRYGYPKGFTVATQPETHSNRMKLSQQKKIEITRQTVHTWSWIPCLDGALYWCPEGKMCRCRRSVWRKVRWRSLLQSLLPFFSDYPGAKW